MTKLLNIICAFIILTSCTKDPAIPKDQSICGRQGFPQGIWKVKFEVLGTTNPDTVIFNMNAGQTKFGTFFYKKYSSPSLPLADSVNFCGDKFSEPILYLYSQDTTKNFTCNIYVNNILRKTAYGHGYIKVVEIISY